MNDDRVAPQTGTAPEDEFLALLRQTPPVPARLESSHVAAAVAASRDAVPLSGRARRGSVISWRKPRMTLTRVAALLAGLSLPAKALAATAVAAAAVGGAAVVMPDAAEDGLTNATEQSGVEVPADGQPDSRPVGSDQDGAGVEALDEIEAQDHAVDGQARSLEAREGRRDFGQSTAAEASDGRSTEGQATATDARESGADADAAAQAEARRQAARERQEAARTEAQARQDAAGASGADTSDSDGDTTSDETLDDDTDSGAEQSAGGREKADEARSR